MIARNNTGRKTTTTTTTTKKLKKNNIKISSVCVCGIIQVMSVDRSVSQRDESNGHASVRSFVRPSDETTTIQRTLDRTNGLFVRRQQQQDML